MCVVTERELSLLINRGVRGEPVGVDLRIWWERATSDSSFNNDTRHPKEFFPLHDVSSAKMVSIWQ